MCGRFSFMVDGEIIFQRFYLPIRPTDLIPRYNIAPGQLAFAIIHDGKQNRIGNLRWGLIPSWSKDEKIAASTINAKAETIDIKPSFKSSFIRKRCIIPADGFYEWKKTGKTKHPMRILLKTEQPFGMAGLYDTWVSPDGQKRSTFTIITTEPNELVGEIHNRMPVILRPEDEAIWLDRSMHDVNVLKSLLKTYPAEKMKAYPVSPIVGNVANDVPECIQEIVN